MTIDENICRLSFKEMVEIKLKNVLRHSAKENLKCNLYRQVIRETEESLIRLALNAVSYNQTKAAQILGINRNTLRKKMKEFNLTNSFSKG